MPLISFVAESVCPIKPYSVQAKIYRSVGNMADSGVMFYTTGVVCLEKL